MYIIDVEQNLVLYLCKLIAIRKGLTAECYNADENNWSSLIDILRLYVDKTRVYVVFDIDTFSFNSILHIIERIHNENINMKLGTFSNKTKIIITPDEIIK